MLKEGLMSLAILANLSCENKVEVKEPEPRTKLVHEYLDLNGNGKYEIHRVIYETGEKRIIPFKPDYHNPDISKELIESSPLIGDERRFLTL